MAKLELPKLASGVRFPSSAPATERGHRPLFQLLERIYDWESNLGEIRLGALSRRLSSVSADKGEEGPMPGAQELRSVAPYGHPLQIRTTR